MTDDDKRRPRYGADLILPVVASLYAIYYMASVWDFPLEAQMSGMFLAGLLLTLTTLFFLRTWLRARSGGWRFELGSVLGRREGRLERLAFVALTAVYPFVVGWGGFGLTTFAFVLCGALLAGLRPLKRAVGFAALAAVGGWLFFIVLLDARFPEGPFERLAEAILPWI